MKYLKTFESISKDYVEISESEWIDYYWHKGIIDIQEDSIRHLKRLSSNKVLVRLIEPTTSISNSVRININVHSGGWDDIGVCECRDEWFLIGILSTEVEKVGSTTVIGKESFYKCDQIEGVLSLLKDLYPNIIS